MNSQRLGSIRRGLTSWLLQRLTSLYMAGFTIFLVLRFHWHPVANYEEWRDWWSGTVIRVALALFIASLLVHIWIGLRSIYMDYLKPWWLRFGASAATALTLALVALWSARLPLLGPQ